MAKIYDFKAQTSRGKELDFAQFEGKVLLVVTQLASVDSPLSLQYWRS